MIETLAISGITVEQSKYSSLSGYDPLNDTYGPESNNDLHMIFPDGSEAWLMVENLGLTSLPLEELYVTDYSTLDLGAEFEIDVNNTTYNIDEVKYTPTFYVSMDYMTEMLQTNYPEDLKYRVPIVLRKG